MCGCGNAKEAHDSDHAGDLVKRLQTAELSKVPAIIAEMKDFERWTKPKLLELLEVSAHGPARKLRASLALLPVDDGQADYLLGRLADAEPPELAVLCDALHGHSQAISGLLWPIVEANEPDNTRILSPAGALARFDRQSPRWKGVAAKVARAMVSVNPIHVSEWLAMLRPVKDQLQGAAPGNPPRRGPRRDPGNARDELSGRLSFRQPERAR